MRQAGTKCSTWENSNLSKQKSHNIPLLSIIFQLESNFHSPPPVHHAPGTTDSKLPECALSTLHHCPSSCYLSPADILSLLPSWGSYAAIYSSANVISCPPGR